MGALDAFGIGVGFRGAHGGPRFYELLSWALGQDPSIRDATGPSPDTGWLCGTHWIRRGGAALRKLGQARFVVRDRRTVDDYQWGTQDPFAVGEMDSPPSCGVACIPGIPRREPLTFNFFKGLERIEVHSGLPDSTDRIIPALEIPEGNVTARNLGRGGSWRVRSGLQIAVLDQEDGRRLASEQPVLLSQALYVRAVSRLFARFAWDSHRLYDLEPWARRDFPCPQDSAGIVLDAGQNIEFVFRW